VGEADPIGFVQHCPELAGEAERGAVLGGTAAALLGVG
jgi:hypothetical protein